ncbi:MAG: NAD(+) synthase [Gammaproteobacteria bacterium]|nr:NAD(+) synthase [Gammaproteobacteria bacterium]
MTDDLRRFGYLRAMAAAPWLRPGDPAGNVQELLQALERAREAKAALLLLPELALTGFSCEDLFFSSGLQQATRSALARLVAATAEGGTTVVVGAPLAVADGRLFNAALVLADGRICGAVPKSHLPNYGEFYDRRWFTDGDGVELHVVDPELGDFRLAARQLFEVAGARVALEICEDLWAPDPPGARHALAGADLILNPSASNELVAKADYRRDLVRMTSAQRICGYLYASAGPGESSKDLVFGGHLLAAENGIVLGEGERFSLTGSDLLVDFDLEHLLHERQRNSTFRAAARPLPYVSVAAGRGLPLTDSLREVAPHPFVPNDEAEFSARAQEILAIQATGLARRMLSVGEPKLVIGLSGGLDSTLAFLVALDALAKLDRSTRDLLAVTMPGPATGERTLKSARALASSAGVTLLEIPIAAAVAQHLADLEHDPDVHDVTFENAQARERTQILFNLANKHGGLVVGTGDLSELALGWCTFNGDHMASYNVNASVPKTLMAYLLRWYARHRVDADLAAILEDVLATPISPELVPGRSDEDVAQHTESLVGPYELHDFFLYHYVRHGSAPEKIRWLAGRAFSDRYDGSTLDRWLGEFLRRFHSQQFKRTTLPPGPKVGSVSLSPRGDWRMPDESPPPKF